MERAILDDATFNPAPSVPKARTLAVTRKLTNFVTSAIGAAAMEEVHANCRHAAAERTILRKQYHHTLIKPHMSPTIPATYSLLAAGLLPVAFWLLTTDEWLLATVAADGCLLGLTADLLLTT